MNISSLFYPNRQASLNNKNISSNFKISEEISNSHSDSKLCFYGLNSVNTAFTCLNTDKNMLNNYENREYHFSKIRNNQDIIKFSRKARENYIDILGNIKLVALDKSDNDTLKTVDEITNKLFSQDNNDSNNKSYINFITTSKFRLNDAIANGKQIIFVMGHKNPDMDSIVSCLAEAYRNSRIDDNAVYIPVINGNDVQNDIKYLLGDKITESLLFSNDPLYKKFKNDPSTKWILVDHNLSKVQDRVIGIIDHHNLSVKLSLENSIPVTCEQVGSTAALITQKMLGSGIKIDRDLARILYGAALRDTGNCKPNKMTSKDELVVKYLGIISKIKDRNAFYSDIMGYSLNFKDSNELFYRDYRNGQFGYSICEMQNIYDENDNISSKNQKIIDELIDIANKNNTSENYPFTLIVIYDFKIDNVTVNKRRIHIVFNKNIPSEHRQEIVKDICKMHYADPKEVVKATDEAYMVDVKQTEKTISRKIKTSEILNYINNNRYLFRKDD